jgi:hypothetical protein
MTSAQFLTRAVQAHAPLRVESRRLIQRLRAGALLAVSEVREAVRALDITARGWREVAERHGLPQVQPLAPAQPESAPPVAVEPEPAPPVAVKPEPAPPVSESKLYALARGLLERTSRFLDRTWREAVAGSVSSRERASRPSSWVFLLYQLAERDSWSALLLLNAGIPFTMGVLWVEPQALCFLIIGVLGSFFFIPAVHSNKFLEVRRVWLWMMIWLTTIVAPILWQSSWGRIRALTESSYYQAVAESQPPSELRRFRSPNPVDDAWFERRTRPEAPGKDLRRLALLAWGLPNLLWLGWVLMGWRRALRGW